MRYMILHVLLMTSLIFAKKLNVVTSIPDIADMVNAIGGDRVKVTALATGQEDLHAVPARPSFLPLLNRADLLFTLGLDAEHAWLPALAEQARNPNIIEGQPGWISLNEGVSVLNIPEKLDRSEGEQHPDGNPHFNVGPHTGVTMAENICNVLCEYDPEGSDLFHKNCDNYTESVKSAVENLKARGAVLNGKKVIAYHEDIAYLCEFYGMDQIAAIEVKPGVPPTASHLHQVEMVAKSQGADLIVHNQSQSSKLPKKLGSTLSIGVAQIANAVGAQDGISTWLELQEYNLTVLLEALGE